MKKQDENKKKSDYVAVIIFFVVTSIIAFWCIDVSISGMLSNGYMSNGFFNIDPMQSYHFGLYMGLLSVFGMAITCTHWFIMGRKWVK